MGRRTNRAWDSQTVSVVNLGPIGKIAHHATTITKTRLRPLRLERTYGGGSVEYFEILDKWRTEGKMKGLEPN